MKRFLELINKGYTPSIIGLGLLLIMLFFNHNIYDIRKLSFVTIFGLYIYEILTYTFLLSIHGKEFFNNKRLYSFSFSRYIKYFFILIGISLLYSVVELRLIGLEKVEVVYIFKILLWCVMIGFSEELLFRGVLFADYNNKYGNDGAYIYEAVKFSSIIFGLIHITNSTFLQIFTSYITFIGAIIKVVQTTILGYYLASILVKTHNLIYCAILHAFFDFSIFLPICVSTSIPLQFHKGYILCDKAQVIALGVYTLFELPLYFKGKELLKETLREIEEVNLPLQWR